MNGARIVTVMLIVVFLALYITPLGVRPLIIPDETRYAEIPREMLASGDWIVPRLNGVRYFEKPVLGYWLTAGAIRLFGQNAFAVRLPFAVAAGLTALLLWAWARRFPGSARGVAGDNAVPGLAVAVFLLSFEVFAIGTFCVLDSLLSFFVTAAIVTLYFAYREESFVARMLLLVLAGLACGLAFLTKGFLALAVPVIVIIPFVIWQGLLRTCLRTAWVPLVVAVLVVLPWGLLIHRREPDFWHYFFWVEHIQRFTSPGQAQHPQPFWFYVPILLAGAMPWTVLLGPIIQGLRHVGLKNPMVRLAICWLVMPFVFFSASSGKLGTYILPCFPPLAFLVAVGSIECLRRDDLKGFAIGAWVASVGATIAFIVLIAGLLVMPAVSASAAWWKWMIIAAGLLLWSLLTCAAIRREDIYSKLLLFSVAPVLFMFSWPFVMQAMVKPRKMPTEFLAANASRIPRDSLVTANNSMVSAVCWSCNRSDVLLIGSRGEYEYGLSYDDSKHRLLSLEQFKALVAGNVNKRTIVLFTDARQYDDYALGLPKPVWQTVSGGLALAQFTANAADANSPLSP
jgi:4-amino-4-deoxy-L-arabinose transferase